MMWQNYLTEFDGVGTNHVKLQSEGPSEESNIGNFLCDAYVSVYDNVQIAFQPNEGISRFFPVGVITFEDILSGHVFANRTLDLVTMKGLKVHSKRVKSQRLHNQY